MRRGEYLLLSGLLICGCGPSVGGDGGGSGDSATSSTTGGDATEGEDRSGSSPSAPDTVDPDTVDPDDGSDGGRPAPACLPMDIHGRLVDSDATSGLNVYAGCDDDYLIEHTGERLVDDVEGIRGIQDEALLLGLPGVTGNGIGLCCEGSEATCLTVHVHAGGFSLDDLLANLSGAFPDAAGLCFGVRVVLRGADGPRCDAADPECLPIPVCNGLQDKGCCMAPPFEPSARRIPVGDEELSGGDCRYDGECVLGGAGVQCIDWTTPDGPGFTECTDEIANAFCGCVDSQCHWFEQL